MAKTELKPALIALSKLLICVVFAWLYQQGGSDFGDKWLRRYLAPTILAGGMYGFSRDWRSLLTAPLLMASLSMGYGADVLWEKVSRRGLFGLASGTAGSVLNIFKRNWLLVGVNIVLLVLLYITMGVWNPLTDARTEELFLGFTVAFIPMMSTRKKGE